MVIGHLPAGYIFSKLGYLKFRDDISNYRKFMFWGVFGSIAPDLDMFYFHLIDHARTHQPTHHPTDDSARIRVLGVPVLQGAAEV